MDKESDLKTKVKDFWDEKSCGEIYAVGDSDRDYYESQGKARFELEPYIFDFAKFKEGQGKDVLEIGVGMGGDHIEWAKSNPKSLTGVDLTPRAIDHTNKRASAYSLATEVKEADAENLPFDDDSFDLVYSWGVLHHSPNTQQAINEAYRVLRTGGIARIMIYHKYSLTGYMLWTRFALLRGRPLRSLGDIYANYLESPGTKAYSRTEAKEMVAHFSNVDIKVQLGFGDLLEGAVGQRHGGLLLSVAKTLWPRPLLRMLCKNHGLYLLIEARK